MRPHYLHGSNKEGVRHCPNKVTRPPRETSQEQNWQLLATEMLKNGRHAVRPGTECEMDITRRRKRYETAKKLCSVKGSVHVHRPRTRRRKCYETAEKQ